MLYPLVLGGVSIVASIVGTFFVKATEGGKIMNALYKGVIVSGVLAAIAFYSDHAATMMGANATEPLRLRALIGLVLTAAMVVITEYYTATEFSAGAPRRRRVDDRPRDEHHRGPRRVDEVDRAAGARGLRRDLGRVSRSPASTASRSPRPRCCR